MFKNIVLSLLLSIFAFNFSYASSTGTLIVKVRIVPRMDINDCSYDACTVNKENLMKENHHKDIYTLIKKGNSTIIWY